jgi:hypothetical protein
VPVVHIEKAFQGSKYDDAFIAAAIGDGNVDPKELSWATNPTPRPTTQPTLSKKQLRQMKLLKAARNITKGAFFSHEKSNAYCDILAQDAIS